MDLFQVVLLIQQIEQENEMIIQLYFSKDPNTQTLTKKLKKMKLRPKNYNKTKKKRKRDKYLFNPEELYIFTGVYEDTFSKIVKDIKEDVINLNYEMEKVKKHSLTEKEVFVHLQLTIHFYRTNDKLEALADKYKYDASTIKKIIQKVSIILNTKLKSEVSFKEKFYKIFAGTVVNGAMDCSTSQTIRHNPFQEHYYRGDKGYHFLGLQLMVDLEGKDFLQYSIALGHNNDQGLQNITGIRKFLGDNNYVVLVDDGYSNTDLCNKKSKGLTKDEAELFHSFRSVVETCFAFLGFFRFFFTEIKSN